VDRRRYLQGLGAGAALVASAGCLQPDRAVLQYEDGIQSFRAGTKAEEEAERMPTPYRNEAARDRFRNARDLYRDAAAHFERSMELAENFKIEEFAEDAMTRARLEREEMVHAIAGEESKANSAESRAGEYQVVSLAAVKQAERRDGFL
jgi:hypothetical protein